VAQDGAVLVTQVTADGAMLLAQVTADGAVLVAQVTADGVVLVSSFVCPGALEHVPVMARDSQPLAKDLDHLERALVEWAH